MQHQADLDASTAVAGAAPAQRKRRLPRASLLLVAVLFSWVASAPAFAAPPSPAKAGSVAITDVFQRKFGPNVDKIDAWYVYTGADNESHIKKITFHGHRRPFFDAKNGLFKSTVDIPNKDAMTFMEGQFARINIYSAPGNIQLPPHASPGSEMFLILRGSATFLGKDGTTQEIGPGDFVIYEDTTGPGHAGRIGPEGFTAINFGFVLQAPISALAKDK